MEERLRHLHSLVPVGREPQPPPPVVGLAIAHQRIKYQLQQDAPLNERGHAEVVEDVMQRRAEQEASALVLVEAEVPSPRQYRSEIIRRRIQRLERLLDVR